MLRVICIADPIDKVAELTAKIAGLPQPDDTPPGDRFIVCSGNYRLWDRIGTIRQSARITQELFRLLIATKRLASHQVTTQLLLHLRKTTGS